MKGTGRLVASLVFVGAVVLASIGAFLFKVTPVLGLDLQGGLSVVLQGPPNASKAVMELTLNRIRDRVDALGVAEPEISLLGSNTIEVQLPGLGGQGTVQQRGSKYCAISSSGRNLGCFASRADAQAKAKAVSVAQVLSTIGKTARLEERTAIQIVQPGGSTTQAGAGVAANTPYAKIPLSSCVAAKNANCPAKQDIWTYLDQNGNGRLDPTEAKYELGPVVITGANLKKATAVYVSSSQVTSGPTGWQIDFSLDKSGTAAFAAATQKANSYYQQNPTNPPPQAQIAILVDKVIISSPVVQGAITGGSGTISGGFTQQSAQSLAVELQSGSLPVSLTQQTVQTVSPTLGTQSLRQGLIAGLAGLIALMLYLAYYYRLLGIVTWLGMGIWATVTIAVISVLGRTVGYALTLAGVAGIVVSIGITADSYIVFYERLKDEVRHGKTLRAAVQPAFRRAWRTIVAADIVTILAAAALYVLSVGSVRGFALTLGLSTLLDMAVVWFYKRPTVFLISRSQRLRDLRGMGLRSGVAAEPVPGEAAPVAGGSR